MSRRIIIIVVVALATLGVTLAGFGIVVMTKSEPTASTVVGQGHPRWPADSLTDWVGFADEVSVVTVLAEKELPTTPDVVSTGDGYVGRQVEMRIDSTIWRRPGGSTTGDTVPVVVDGWWSHGHKLVPYREWSGRRIEVGERLLVPLIRSGDGRWWLLSSASVVGLGPNGVTLDERQAAEHPAVAAALRGRTVRQIASVLAATRPDDIAAANQDIDPDARAEAVWSAQLEAAGKK